MPWCFAKLNNKLAEIFFDETKKGPKIWGHCYVKKEEYKTKQEQKWIKNDTMPRITCPREAFHYT